MLINLTKDEVIIKKVKTLDTAKLRNQGLMFKKKQTDTAFLFYYYKPEYPAIHMFFVFHSIDVIYVDKDFKVVGIKENVLPFTPLILPPNNARHFFELPSGSLKNKKISIGDFLCVPDFFLKKDETYIY